MRWIAVAALLVAGFALWSARVEGREEAVGGAVRARSFSVVDGNGQVRAFLGMGGGPAPAIRFKLFDEAGGSRFVIDQYDGGEVHLGMTNEKQQPYLVVSGATTEEASVGFLRVFGATEAGVKSSDVWGGSIRFTQDGKQTARVP